MPTETIDQSYNYRAVTTDVDGKTIAITGTIETSELLVLHQQTDLSISGSRTFPVPRDANLFVHGDVVRVYGEISAPGCTVRIVCRRLQAAADRRGKSAAINVDGKTGDAPPNKLPKANAGNKGPHGVSGKQPFPRTSDKPGDTGEIGAPGGPSDKGHPGGQGGTIEIFAERIADDVVLRLSAIGGTGGKGQDGQDAGDGGPGGDGKDEVRGFYGFFTENATAGGRGGPGGTGGKGGQGGKGGAGGTIRVRAISGPAGGFATVVRPGNGGPPGAGGAAGGPGRGGVGGLKLTTYTPGDVHAQHRLAEGDDGGLGAPGDKGDGAEAPGPTEHGDVTIDLNSGYAALAEKISSSQAHMVLQRARLAYLAAGETLENKEALDQSNELLQWLHNVLKEVPSTAANADACGSLVRRVDGLLSSQMSQTNFFARDVHYAPRISLETHRKLLDDALASLECTEAAYTKYFQAFQQKTEASQHLTNVNAQVQAALEDIDRRSKEVAQQLDTVVEQIGAAEREIEDKRAALNEKLVRFKEAVTNYFNLDVGQLLACLETLSFTPAEPGPQQAAMLASQTAKILGSTTDDITTDAGTQGKRYLVHRLDVFGRDVHKLAEGYRIAQDRSVALDDPNAYKLQMKREQFDEICDQFFTYSDDLKAAPDARQAMDDYVDSVQDRNARIFEYNLLLRQQQDLKGRAAGLALRRREVETQLAANAAPGLPAMTSFVADVYEQAKDRCLSLLYDTSRAYCLWSLEHYSLFGDLLKGSPAELNHFVLKSGRDKIMDKLKRASERLARPRQEFHRVTVVMDERSHPNVLRTLRTKNVARFIIPPAVGDTKREESPFVGLADVRITKVRPWAVGMKTDDDVHHIVLTHLGKETFVTPGNRTRTFSHQPVATTFIYDASAGIESDAALEGGGSAEDGTIKDPEGGHEYSQIGPFARWQISISKSHHLNLKLDGLSAIHLEFHGLNHTLPRPMGLRP